MTPRTLRSAAVRGSTLAGVTVGLVTAVGGIALAPVAVLGLLGAGGLAAGVGLMLADRRRFTTAPGVPRPRTSEENRR